MIKQYELNIDPDKFINQCGGVVTDFCDGCLIDNLFIAGKRGYYFLNETAVNTWNSKYIVYFAKYTDLDAVNTLFNKWDAFANADTVETA